MASTSAGATWRSTLGAFSVGDAANGKTRQITGVAAGMQATDAVNIAQLQAAQTHYYSVNDGGTVSGNYNNDGATGANALAAGVKAAAGSQKSIAIGYDAQASGTSGDAIAIGSGSRTTGDQAVGIGKSAAASGGSSVAIGSAATATGGSNVAIGNNASATIGGWATALGFGAKTTDTAAAALGYNAQAGYYGTALGAIAVAGNNATAVGTKTTASGSASLAAGYSANSSGQYSTAVGPYAKASGQGSTALGGNYQLGANAVSENSVALGSGSVANVNKNVVGVDPRTGLASTSVTPVWKSTTGAVSVGDVANGTTRQIVSVAAGTADSDAVNVAQLKSATTHYYSVKDNGTTGGNYANDGATGTNALAAGVNAVASGQSAVAVGLGSNAAAQDSVAVGHAAQATVDNGVALGSGSVASTGGGIAGYVPSGISAAESAAINATTSTVGTVSVGNAGSGVFRQITSVAAGTADSDAVNVAQLKGVDVKASAGWNLQANGGSATNIGPGDTVDVVNGNNINVTQSGNELTIATADDVNFTSVTTGNTRIDTDGLAIAGGPSITASGIDAGGLVISNVAPGVAGTDAVNVDQLNAQGDELTAKGLTFAGNEGLDVHRDLGETLAITGEASTTGSYSGANLKTVTDPLTGAIQLQMAESPKFGNVTVNADGSGRITGVTAGTNDTDAVNVSQLGAATADAVMYDDSTHNTVTLGGDTYNTTTKLGGTRIKNVAAGVDGGDAVNVDQLNDMGGELTAKGMDFLGNDGNIAHRDLGETLTIRGEGSTAGSYSGANLQTVVDPLTGTIGMQMAESPKFGNVTINDGGSGKITGVTAGTDDTDAVNVGQLKDVKDLASAGWSVSDTNGHSANIGANGKVTFKGDSNIGVAQNGVDQDGQIAVTLSRDLDVDSVTAGDTVINNAGLTIKNGPSVTINGISAGGKKITNVANGEVSETSTDAVNGSQLFALGSQLTNIDGRVTNIEGSITNITNGGGIKYFHANSTKDDSSASGANSVAAGPAAVASGAGSVAMGDEAKATADQATAVGANASASGTGASAFGNNATAEGNGSLAMGDGAKATKEKSSAIGSGAQATARNAVALGADSIADREDSVSVGSKGKERQITNVKAGVEDTDAVNVAQLKGVSGAVSNLDNRVTQVDSRVTKVEGDVSNIQNGTDGMFQVNNTSNLPKPKPTGRDAVAGGAGAEASGANGVAIGTKSKAAGENSVAMGNGASASARNSVAVGANSVADRDNSVSVGSAGNERQITHLAAGRADTDAVNVGQLTRSLADVTNNANSYTDSRYAQLKNDLNKQDDVLSAGIAGALAQASLPQPYSPGASMAAAGVGNYRGQSSLAVGVSRISDNGKWVTKLQGNADTQGEVGVSVGVGYQW
ncbi:surface protein [Pseudomonas sp. ATCC 13867]|nr:surface protein [Pseudomonas sp. ATCC 13867]